MVGGDAHLGKHCDFLLFRWKNLGGPPPYQLSKDIVYIIRKEISGFDNYGQTGGGEYNSHEFTKFRDKHGIVWGPIIPGNPQTNGVTERLGQTLYKMASTMLKDSRFDLRYWPELVLIANYLRNRGPVVGRSLIPYKADIGHKPLLGHLRRIGQIGLSQSRNLIQAGGIGKIEQNVADLLDMRGIISIAWWTVKEKSSGIPGLHG